jgi:hypothetical protein
LTGAPKLGAAGGAGAIPPDEPKLLKGTGFVGGAEPPKLKAGAGAAAGWPNVVPGLGAAPNDIGPGAWVVAGAPNWGAGVDDAPPKENPPALGAGAALLVAPKLNAGVFPTAAGAGAADPNDWTGADIPVEEALPNEKAGGLGFGASCDADPAPNEKVFEAGGAGGAGGAGVLLAPNAGGAALGTLVALFAPAPKLKVELPVVAGPAFDPNEDGWAAGTGVALVLLLVEPKEKAGFGVALKVGSDASFFSLFIAPNLKVDPLFVLLEAVVCVPNENPPSVLGLTTSGLGFASVVAADGIDPKEILLSDELFLFFLDSPSSLAEDELTPKLNPPDTLFLSSVALAFVDAALPNENPPEAGVSLLSVFTLSVVVVPNWNPSELPSVEALVDGAPNENPPTLALLSEAPFFFSLSLFFDGIEPKLNLGASFVVVSDAVDTPNLIEGVEVGLVFEVVVEGAPNENFAPAVGADVEVAGAPNENVGPFSVIVLFLLSVFLGSFFPSSPTSLT